MKKFIVFFIFVIILNTTVQASDNKEKSTPKVDALGSVLIDAQTGRVLWGKNENKELAMASTTKIMTAIIALENGNLDDTVKISSRAIRAPETKMHLSLDEEIKLEYLLYGLMMQSYNDTAIAIAEHVFGSVEKFCDVMTKKAKEIGAEHTCFETPNGLDSENHYSTAKDMAMIAKYALQNKKFRQIISTPNLTVSSNKKTYEFINKNRLLREVNGATGVKTGFTGKAGHCFVGSVKRDGMELISVVLGSGWGLKGKEQKWIDTKEILSYGFDNFKYQQIVNINDIADKKINIERSKILNSSVYFGDNVVLPLTSDEIKSINIVLDMPNSIKAPIFKDEKIGKAKIYVNNNLEKEVDLLLATSATRHDLKTSFEKVLNNWLSMTTVDSVNILLPEV